MRKKASVKSVTKANAVGERSLAIAMSVTLALSMIGSVLPQVAVAQVAPTCNLTVVSDPTNVVVETGQNAVVAAWNQFWQATIPGATWIWKSALVENPTQDETYTFRKTFEWHGEVQTALLDLATDNSFRVSINNYGIATSDAVNYTSATQRQVYVSPAIFEGTNTIDVQVTNIGSATSTPETNHAGAFYRLHIHGAGCPGGDLPTCSDSVDNDSDGQTDYLSDTDCTGWNSNEELNPGGTSTSTSTSTPPTPPVPAPSNGGGGSGPAGPTITVYAPEFAPSGTTGGEVLGAATTTETATSTSSTIPASNLSQGEVLSGATTPAVPTACNANGEYVSSYLRIGRMNDPMEVSKLQTFLNEHMNAGLPVTGFFGSLTKSAVDAFQLKHKDEVLKPWADHGFPDTDQPSGYVYLTTRWFLNKLKCNTDAVAPQLP